MHTLQAYLDEAPVVDKEKDELPALFFCVSLAVIAVSIVFLYAYA